MTAPIASPQRYRAFGLTIDSEVPLPELDAIDTAGDADVRVRLRPIARARPEGGGSLYRYGDADQFLYWPEVGAFLISGDGEIDIDPTPGASEGLLRLPLLGPVMALLLHMRGMLVLHASAVVINGRIAAFVGDKGAGKSTTAAAALSRGHSLYTDDLLAIAFSANGAHHAAPGYASIKLVDDCADLFSFAYGEEFAPPIEAFPKRIRRLERAPAESAPLAAIYVLGRGEATQIAPLPKSEALRAAMRYAYAPLFDGKPWARDETQRLFSQCAALSSAVRVARLETPSEPHCMAEAVACVEADLA